MTITDGLDPTQSTTYTVTVTANTLGTLTVASAAGTEEGTTALTVSPAIASGNIYKYVVDDDVADVAWGDDLTEWTTWDGTSDITAANGKKLTLAECNSDAEAVKAGSVTVVANSGE